MSFPFRSINQDEAGKEVDQHLVVLRIGRPGTEDYVCYETWQPRRKNIKRARHKLAEMALEDLFGDTGDYFDPDDGDFVDSYAWDVSLEPQCRQGGRDL